MTRNQTPSYNSAQNVLQHHQEHRGVFKVIAESSGMIHKKVVQQNDNNG